MRTIVSNEEATHWNRSNHLRRIRLLLSSDDSDNIFSGTSLGTLESRKPFNQTILVTGTV
jgi:hypothetical protein